jgi:hypothetical protein
LRVLQTSFVAPVPPGLVLIEAKILRSGRSVTHAEARIIVQGQVGCLVVGIFGQGRPSTIRVQPPKSEAPLAESAALFPWVEGVTPEFTRQIIMRWVDGVRLYKGASEPKTQIYVGFRDEPFAGPGALGESQIIGYADMTPSPAITLVSEPVAASSLTWTLELLTDDFGPARPGLWMIERDVEAGGEGYTNETAIMWSPEGQPVALSRQSVAVFA